jgi:hypothetical protein
VVLCAVLPQQHGATRGLGALHWNGAAVSFSDGTHVVEAYPIPREALEKKAQFVLFWLAELHLRRKTVQSIELLLQETAHYKQAEGKHAGQPKPRAGLHRNV